MADGFRRKIFLITFWILLIWEIKPIASVSYNFISGNLKALLRPPEYCPFLVQNSHIDTLKRKILPDLHPNPFDLSTLKLSKIL